MFEITGEDIAEIQTVLLGQYKRFTSEQTNIIQYERSGDIVACPGSGKTTVLIAKIAILLKKIKEENSNDGICIITHTNVGVDEILNKLKILGISQVSYPHFIGTIHEFLNSFFAIKAYSRFSKNDRFYFMENEEYKVHFARFFEKHKPMGWSVQAPFRAVDRTKLSINGDDEISLVGYEDKSYRNELLNTFKDMFHSGYLRHSDTIALSKYYVDKNSNRLGNAFESRFKYFFIDETQDTSIEQYDIILKLIEGNHQTIVQCYGDPYQALYNLYYGEPDAWNPPIEERKEIATSNRFGENIAKILRTTCIERYDHLVGSEMVSSLAPHILLYSDPLKVLEVYCRIVESCNFPASKNKIYAVAQHHNAVLAYHENYQRVKSDTKNSTSFADCLNEVYKVLSRTLRRKDRSVGGRLKYSPNRIDDLLRHEFPIEHGDLRSNLTKIIRQVFLSNDFTSEFKQFSLLYENLLKEGFGVKIGDEEVNSDIDLIRSYILKSPNTNKNPQSFDNNIYQYNDISVHLNTVHGVKGETHLATLLLESTVNREELSDLTDIMPFLLGNYDKSLIQQTEIKDTLKLAYVALSRPTDFVGIALKEEHMTPEDIIAATEYGWKVVRVEDYEQ